MRKQIIILGLFITTLSSMSMAYEVVSLQRPSTNSGFNFPRRSTFSNMPSYRYGYNTNRPYRYGYGNNTRYWTNDDNVLRRIKILRKLRNNIYNNLSFDPIKSIKNSLQGRPTGWSTPITSDAYDLLNPNYSPSYSSNRRYTSPDTSYTDTPSMSMPVKNSKRNNNNTNILKDNDIKSPTTQTDIFVLPGRNNATGNNKGHRENDTGGIAGRTGVTIIYD